MFASSVSLRNPRPVATNDRHLHRQSRKRSFLQLFQVALGLEGQHLQVAV